jgi:predicted enzyme related to lactoylglutathione lyase
MAFITGTDFVTVSVTDFERAIEFYGETLELPELKRYGQMPGCEFETGNLTLSIMKLDAFGPMTHQASVGPIALQVDDVEEARAKLEAKGVQFSAPTLDSGVCHMAFFQDPDGNALILHHRYAPPGAVPPAAAG